MVCFSISFLYLYCLISRKIFLTLPSLLDREPNTKMEVLLILKNGKNFFSRGFDYANWLPVDFLQGFNFANLTKIRKKCENLSHKQFLSLR